MSETEGGDEGKEKGKSIAPKNDLTMSANRAHN